MIDVRSDPPVNKALHLTMQFPSYLKRLRYLLGYTQKELGDSIGVAQYDISRWERGRRIPDDVTIFNFIILWLQELEEQTNGDKNL